MPDRHIAVRRFVFCAAACVDGPASTAYAYAPAPLDGNLVTIAHPGAAWAKPQSWVAAAGTLSWNEYRGYEDVEVVAYSANPTRTRYGCSGG